MQHPATTQAKATQMTPEQREWQARYDAARKDGFQHAEAKQIADAKAE